MKALKNFFACVAADFYKLLHMKSLYIGLAVMAFLTLIVALATNAATDFILNATGDLAPSEGLNVTEINYSSAFTVISSSPSAAGVYYLVPIIVALFIGMEFSGGTMRLIAGHGVSRTEIYFAKWLTAVAVTLFYVCLSFLFGTIAAAALGGDAGFFNHYGNKIAASFGTNLMLALCMASIFTAISFFIRSKAGSVAILLVMNIALGSILTTIIQLALGMMTSPVTPANYSYMFLNPYFNMSALANAAGISSKELALALGGSAMWTVLFSAGGWLSFVKTDIK